MKTPLNQAHAEFLLHQLDTTDGNRLKRSLQELCQLYRSGRFVHGADRQLTLRNKLNGLVFKPDPKVRRWALNAIAVAGKREHNEDAVTYVLEKHADDPEAVAAAVAALAVINPASLKSQGRKRRLDKDMLVLAALQHGKVEDTQLRKTKIDIERAASEALKLALLLVGMSKAPEYLFHPRHGNAAIVTALGKHHDPIVSQYSVWAITENKDFGVRDLGIDINRLDEYPSNVRAWANRLVGSDQGFAIDHLELLERGSQDPAQEAREGLAIGIKYTCFDGLEEFTVQWLNDEGDQEIRAYIVDHMATNAHKIPTYRKMVELEYTDTATSLAKRSRIEAMCEGTPVYRELRKLSIQEQMGSLGLGGPTVQIGHLEVNVSKNASKDINITGSVQAGTISSGDGANSLGTSNFIAPSKVVAVQRLLDATSDLLQDPGVEPSVKKELAADVAEARTQPSPGRIEKVMKGLAKLETASTSSEKVIDAARNVWKQLSSILMS
jgi:hypothetical protein